MSAPELLAAYPVVIEIPVAWGEMDAFGHVNNVAYFRYFESARIACFERLDILEEMQRSGAGPILAQTRCRFKLPVRYPDCLAAGTRIGEIGEDRFIMEYAVASDSAQRIAAEGDGTIVWFDYRAGRKTALPPDLVRRIRALS